MQEKVRNIFFFFIFCEACQKLLIRPLLPDYLLVIVTKKRMKNQWLYIWPKMVDASKLHAGFDLPQKKKELNISWDNAHF